MPCSNCSLVGFSPTLAKWPLAVMTEGAVGCLMLFEGRVSFPLDCGDRSVDMMNAAKTNKVPYTRARAASRVKC